MVGKKPPALGKTEYYIFLNRYFKLPSKLNPKYPAGKSDIAHSFISVMFKLGIVR